MSTAGKVRQFLAFEWLGSRRLEGAAHLATTGAVIVGAVSLVSQCSESASQNMQFKNQVSIQRELAISDRWQDHIRISIQHPDLSVSNVSINKMRPEDREKYVWFVEDMIYSSERILQYAPKDPQWINTIMYEMRVKRPYIVSDEFLGCPRAQTNNIENCSNSRNGEYSSSYCTYTPELRSIVRRAFREDRAGSARLTLAESKCHWDVPAETVGVQPNA